jgi:hypothetical protein
MNQLIDLLDRLVVGFLGVRRLIAPPSMSGSNVQPDGIQRLQHGVMEISSDTGAIFQERAQAAFSRFERGR